MADGRRGKAGPGPFAIREGGWARDFIQTLVTSCPTNDGGPDLAGLRGGGGSGENNEGVFS